ncbi:MAG: hypothetical protein ACR2OZ_07445 [Verrucomicrobiales bacterium]
MPILLFAVLASTSVIGATITFEDYPVTVSNEPLQVITSHGYEFRGIMLLRDDSYPHIPNNGSKILVHESLYALTVSAMAGLSFDLLSVRVAEGRNIDTGFFDFSARSVRFLGNKVSGAPVELVFNLDLQASEDVAGDFETIHFGGFDGLASLEIIGQGGVSRSSFALDDVVLVPEPSNALMWGLVLAWPSRRSRGKVPTI